MKICVLSGSPKGKYSITLQTVNFLQRKFKQDEFTIVHVGQTIKQLEKDIAPVLQKIEQADLILFSYPVYTFIAPYQLHRFIELLTDIKVNLSNKYCAQISTSKHFYDVTAHNFIKENAMDLGLKYLGGLSADMDDILTEKGQNDALSFWNLIKYRAENNIFEMPVVLEKKNIEYKPLNIQTEKTDKKEIVIVASIEEGDQTLINMIEDFRAVYNRNSKVVNINEYKFTGGCLGCFNCATSGKCVYKDGFDEYLRNEIQTASAIVYAFRIKNHSMGSRMKLYDDRQFCNGHRAVTMGMPVGYLVQGDLSCEPNLKMIIEGRGEVGGNFICGIAQDANGVENLAKTLDYALENNLTLPSNFYGVGGMKIFRDLIYIMRGMMKADHKFYKKHKLYDFPQKKKMTVLKMKLVGALISNPKIKAKLGNKLNEGMIAPYKKMFDKMDKGEKV